MTDPEIVETSNMAEINQTVLRVLKCSRDCTKDRKAHDRTMKWNEFSNEFQKRFGKISQVRLAECIQMAHDNGLIVANIMKVQSHSGPTYTGYVLKPTIDGEEYISAARWSWLTGLFAKLDRLIWLAAGGLGVLAIDRYGSILLDKIEQWMASIF